MNMETERLKLRKFRPDDWKDLYEYLSQESVVRFEPYKVFTEEACKEEALYRSTQDAFWAVCLKENDKLIGNVYFEHTSPKQLHTWEIGYVFNPAYYGQGYATESCLKIMQYGFEELNAHRIIAMCDPQNPASWHLLERLQMRREAHHLQGHYFWEDQDGNPIWHDTFVYAMLAEEWFDRNH